MYILCVGSSELQGQCITIYASYRSSPGGLKSAGTLGEGHWLVTGRCWSCLYRWSRPLYLDNTVWARKANICMHLWLRT
jgi:hypothetical protein